MSAEYGIEKRLRELNKDLHERYRNCVVVSGQMLGRYENYFPDFTDHTLLHTMDILDFCNRLIGAQMEKLTDADLYVLAMGALFHDVGMGVSCSDFEEFGRALKIPMPGNASERAWAVRDYHQELSGLYLEKYWRLFDLPNERYAYAVIQVCRGHRKTDLTDEKAYPVNYEVEQSAGKSVCLPYLAALLCLADELDISVGRNISFMYDVEKMPNARDRREFRRHMAIRSVELEEEKVIVRAWSENPEICRGVEEVCAKLKDKLRMCRNVAAKRSPFVISQTDVQLIWEAGL